MNATDHMGITECNESREWLNFQELGFWSNFTYLIQHSTENPEVQYLYMN
jgi:hypothetical protein